MDVGNAISMVKTMSADGNPAEGIFAIPLATKSSHDASWLSCILLSTLIWLERNVNEL